MVFAKMLTAFNLIHTLAFSKDQGEDQQLMIFQHDDCRQLLLPASPKQLDSPGKNLSEQKMLACL